MKGKARAARRRVRDVLAHSASSIPRYSRWERLWNEGLRDTYRAMYRKARDIATDRSRSDGTSGIPTRSRRSIGPSRTISVRAILRLLEGGDVSTIAAGRGWRATSRTSTRRCLRTSPRNRPPSSPTACSSTSEAPLGQLPTAGLRPTTCAARRAAPSRASPAHDANLARYRNRHSHWRKEKEDDAGRRLCGSEGDVRRRRTRHLLSRKYSEMRLDNLRAAGRAVRDAKVR